MSGLSSNAQAGTKWLEAKNYLAKGDVHAAFAAFSHSKAFLDHQISQHHGNAASKYLSRATSIEVQQVNDELARMSKYFKEHHYEALDDGADKTHPLALSTAECCSVSG